MILADKIIYLRKKAGWSQEDLAMEMDVSRQSVSKWEGALSIPDMDKILKMSQVFGVSTDFLLKEDIEFDVDTFTPSQENLRSVSAEEADQFLTDNKVKAKKIALAVMLFILSPVLLVATEDMGSNLAYIISMLCLLGFVATGVIICISTIANSKRYEYLEKEPINLMFGVKGIVSKRSEAFNSQGYTMIGLGVGIIIMSVIPAILGSEVLVESQLTLTSLTLVMISIGVFIIVFAGIQFAGFKKLLQEEDYSIESKKSSKLVDLIAGPYWLLTTALYLLLSFQNNAWDKTWVIWPVAGILFGAIAALIEGLQRLND